MIEVNECPICGFAASNLFISSLDFSTTQEEFSIRQCSSCNFRFTSPIPSEDRIGDYYQSEDYISHSDSKKGLMNKVYHVVRKRAIRKKEKLISTVNGDKVLLDIGCGTGDFLKFCNDKGWSCSGLEPDEGARKICQSKGVAVQDIHELHQIGDGTVSVVTMWHVLEHVYHLDRDLKKICGILNDYGKLIIAVPNCSSYDAKKYGEFWAAYDLPIHLYHFQPCDVVTLANKHGMKVEKILPMKYDAYYVSMLSEKYKGGNIFKALLTGAKSNIKANSKNNAYSSQIYVLIKK